MIIPVLNKLFDSNQKEIKKLAPLVSEINALEEKIKKLKDADFAKKTSELKTQVKNGESLDSVLPEAFALVRQAAHRAIGQRHYDVQLMAAITLSHGKIAEQKTGEGKTLSALPALYLHALRGRGVHLVTVNDYLARRDAGWMGPVFHLLGISVSSIISEESFLFDPSYTNPDVSDSRLAHLKPIARREAYEADVTYGINSEFGFDYLRDNMAQDIHQVVQRGYYYAVVDEVDSVLIDEARTPHIISAPDEAPTEKYYQYSKLIDKLAADTDYKIDEKLKIAHLTDHGIAKIEKMFGISNIYEKDFDTVYHLEAALKARTLFHKEKDYIVKDGQAILVDEFTGRLLQGRRLSEGLHQAIEAKENVPIQRESKTLATVSLQNYFRMYEHLAGMTGTAMTEAEEFHKIYKLEVLEIPTHRQMTRVDHADAVYKTNRAKIAAIIKEIEEAHKIGQPVLVGTTAIDKNEIISVALKRRRITHELLNAKNHEREAEIIAQAGKKGAVTVATNMAGRGVDIILGGETPPDDDKKAQKEWEKQHKEVLSVGGLYVIGTERHESRRIDNQLRGRSGRQGDPGKSKFFVALDDEIMRLFGGDTIAGLMTRFNMPEDVPLEHGIVSRAIQQAQGKVEGFNFDIRKHLVDYDDVLNRQREIIYKRRRNILEAETDQAANETFSLKSEILEKIAGSVGTLVSLQYATQYTAESSPVEKVVELFTTVIPFDEASQKQLLTQLEQLPSMEEQISFLTTLSQDVYEKREKDLGDALMRSIERFVMLSTIDTFWMQHLDTIENLRQGIGLRGYGQRDPLVEYKNEAFRLFENLINTIDDEIVHRIYKVQVADSPEAHAHVHQFANTPESEVSTSPSQKSPLRQGFAGRAKVKGQNFANNKNTKLGRNDPCPCGSGKKWKKCHYPATSA